MPFVHNSKARIYDLKNILNRSWTWTLFEELECVANCRKMLPHRQNQETTGLQPPAALAQRLAWDWQGRCLAHITHATCQRALWAQMLLNNLSCHTYPLGIFFTPAHLRTCLENQQTLLSTFIFSPAARSLLLTGYRDAGGAWCAHWLSA